MKKLILVLCLLLSINVFSQNKDKCVKTSVERLDDARVKVITDNRCTKTITVKTYLVHDWIKIQAQEKRKREKELTNGKRK